MKSAPGEGSSFTVVLPFRPSHRKLSRVERGPRIKGDINSGLLKPLKILAVDDNDESRFLIGLFLKKLGHEADVASGAHDALAKIRTKRYDVILMDVQMPDMDGYETTQVIRTLEGPVAATPIVALTANVMSGDSDKAFRAGMDDYLSKPIDIEALRDLLTRWSVRIATQG